MISDPNAITLTGATMSSNSVPTNTTASTTTRRAGTTSSTSSSGVGGGGSMAHSHSHHSHHFHSHDHSHDDNNNNTCGLEMTENPSSLSPEGFPSIQDLLAGKPHDVLRAFTTLLRFGRFEAMQPLVEGLLLQQQQQASEGSNTAQSATTTTTTTTLKALLQDHDEGGHSLLHWAAKRGDDLRFLQTLVELVLELDLKSIINIPSKDNVGMTPLHWACTEASIPHVALLLAKGGADIEAKDASGCTPLLIAAQYGQVEVVAFLLQKGAHLLAVDKSGDTALHWAAYKGSIPVCGLLGYYDNALTFAMTDHYGQTPLHLAALRGHTSVVRYILRQLGRKAPDVLFLKDKNGRTPLDLAIHKNRPNVQAVLKEHMAALEDPRGHFFRQTLWTQARDFFRPSQWKQWMITGSDEIDSPMKAPFYFMVGNYVIHLWLVLTCFLPLWDAESGLLWDKSGWILLNVVFMVLSWYFFVKTWRTPPGYIDSSHKHFGPWQQQYEATLEQYANVMDRAAMDSLPQLCHTCHVARPHRSKHCKVARKCVLVFDHYCPFVDNTIGLYNYRYFYLLLVFMTFGLLTFGMTMILYLSRYSTEHSSLPWVTFAWTIEISLCLFPVAGMAVYHTQLAMVNLTTNEHINVKRYRYLWQSPHNRKYKNPWFKGSWGNMMDRLFPSDACYMIAEDQVPLQEQTNGMDAV